jgi:hypothetical protein
LGWNVVRFRVHLSVDETLQRQDCPQRRAHVIGFWGN